MENENEVQTQQPVQEQDNQQLKTRGKKRSLK